MTEFRIRVEVSGPRGSGKSYVREKIRKAVLESLPASGEWFTWESPDGSEWGEFRAIWPDNKNLRGWVYE